MDELKDKGHEMIQKWEEKSRDFINNFTQLFGPDGTLVRIYFYDDYMVVSIIIFELLILEQFLEYEHRPN